MNARKTVIAGIMFVGAAVLCWQFPPDQALADPTALGCGEVNGKIPCDGCQGHADDCACVSNKCKTRHNVCTEMSTAFTVCDPPDSGAPCFKRPANCSWRWQCNNSLGKDLGPCTSFCSTSTEKVDTGDPRTEYYCDAEECECTGVPV